MDQLRRPFLIISLVAVALAMLIALGAGLVQQDTPAAQRVQAALVSAQSTPALAQELERRGVDLDQARDQLAASTGDQPPGMAIPALALISGLLLLVLILTALPMLVGDRTTGNLQGVVSIVGGLIGLIIGIVVAILAFTALMLMVSMFLAVPFGTLAYLAVFGSFDTATAAAMTTVIMALLVIGLICLILAQERFLKSVGLMLLFATALALTFVTALLHGIVPGILVSITDALAALIIGIVAAVWALVILIGGIVAAVRLLQLGRHGGPAQLQRTPAPGAPLTR